MGLCLTSGVPTKGDDVCSRMLCTQLYCTELRCGGDPFTLKRAKVKLTGLERAIAQRVISAYRTVSSNAALLLARLPPVEFVAPMRRRVFLRFKELREQIEFTRESKNAAKELEFYNMCEQWRAFLERPNTPGEFTKMAIVPRLEAWLMRKVGSMSFHLTQIMTGHGCFGRFLGLIGKRADCSCDFCGEEDDAVHTLRDCPAWDVKRLELKRKLNLNRDFTLGDVVENIIASRDF